ncbi:NAD(P) transhydrogenase subunit alpha [Novosphingobium sp. KACC 22771]|uniref:NAD(P) transhydrogenase subunit alpha n=1 Tax=Novosphingobium sp. KACC 22771 TaxID=3025670 RepID=UPI0023665EAF|nr:NAD(P) transhydrogenase subunit alpha [Novosphingobium sp. KACC 22771]WDF72496.1 NAD(P) transhydrogenase subunit alpha [Novosphingobium sp. KACC 22771]
MYVNIAVLKETRPHERRVALMPSVVPKLTKLGARLHMQSGAAEAIRLPDADYEGVVFMDDRTAMVEDADVVLCVQPPALDVIDAMKPGAILICFVYAANEPELVKRLLARRITCFAMERIPRISRAQAMDALSSQSALAGYYAVALGMAHLDCVLPKITSAAGVIGPARVLVMGLGVAGLEAIATAQRLGAVVEGYDVRPETREQALSLGATFVDTGVDATGKGGYARELTAQEKTSVDVTLTRHIQASDLIITTATIPGKASPRLISKAQVSGMKSGAVIVDLSAEVGGNCEMAQPGKTIQLDGVTIVAPLNVPSCLAASASDLYAKNVFNLLALMLHDNVIMIDWADEVLAKTALTHDGKLGGGESAHNARQPAREGGVNHMGHQS